MTYQKPVFNTPEYWNDVQKGLISRKEYSLDMVKHEMKKKKFVREKSSFTCHKMFSKKLSYNTPEYWRAFRNGHLSWEDLERDHEASDIRRKRAIEYYNKKAQTPSRHVRPEPFESKQ